MGSIKNVAVSAFLLVACVGCAKSNDSYPVNLTGYNHSISAVSSYSVKINGGAGTGAGFLAPGSGGGGMTCCIAVPKEWNKNITATVTVDFDNSEPITKTVPIPKYDRDSSSMNVHFLHNGNVRVFVTNYLLGHRKYPLSGKAAEMKPGVPVQIIWH